MGWLLALLIFVLFVAEGAHATTKPRIDSFTPSSGPVGTQVTIFGANFDGATAVLFKDGVPAVFTVDSSSQITAVVPEGAISGRIKVTTPAGTATSSTAFKVVRAPELTSFAPASGAVGDVVKLSGANFVDVIEVSFGSVEAPFAVVSPTAISATVPPGAAAGPITVVTAGGSVTSASAFQVIHGRTASFRRPRPLVGTGTVTVVDGFAPCRQGIVVKVQRKISDTWRTVAQATTSAAGSFRVRLRSRAGPYRAMLPSQTLPSGDVCGPSSSGLPITTSTNLQALVDSHPAGSTFLLPAGTWSLSSTLVPKNGDVFIGAGRNRTILEGFGQRVNGVDSMSRVRDVKLANLAVRGFDQGIRTGPGWVVQGVQASNNRIGIQMYGNDVVVLDSYVHHNAVFGVHGTASVGQEMIGSEVAFNHTDSRVSTGYSGGAKWVNARNLLVRGNDIHDNLGNGLWLDNDTRQSTVADNRIHDNTDEGLRIEITSTTLIQGNVVRGNVGGGIDVVNSRQITVSANTISAPGSAIYVLRFLGNGRKSGGVEYVNADNRAESNTIILLNGTQRVGVLRAAGTTFGNSFDFNAYRAPSAGSPYFLWWTGSRKANVDWTSWTGTFDQDVNGSLSVS